MLKKCVMVAALALVLAPASAHADWLFTPNLGGTFGGSTNGGGGTNLTLGAGIGWMGGGMLGWEADFGYMPDFDSDDFTTVEDSNVVSAMGNVIIGAPVGGQFGAGFRPYFTTGLGLLRRNIDDADDLFDVSSTDFGFNVGGGAMGFATDSIGFRGDLRYVRSFEDLEETFDAGAFDYWRATGGVTFRW